MDKHYHPIVCQRLQAIFEGRDWDALTPYLTTLSNSHFRTAGYLIGERFLPAAAAADFWTVAQRLILWDAKAFTVTVGKAATARFLAATLSLQDAGFLQLMDALQGDSHVIDREKLLRLWLPSATKPETMELLFNHLGVQAPRRRVDFLLQYDNLPAAFVLLRTLRFEEHDRDYLTGVCRQLIRRAATQSSATSSGGCLSFNLASLLRTYFDLPDLRGTFSLQLEPYELTRIDTDYEVFRRAVTKV